MQTTALGAAGDLAPGTAPGVEDEIRLLQSEFKFPAVREDLSTAIPLTVIYGLLLVTGCIGNICTAIVIARPKNKYMHTATNYYLFSLAISDFLFLTLGLPQEMYTLWQRYPYAFGESFCIIRGYLSEASTYASILTISAFTVERYVAICHPLWAHTMSQLPRAITTIVIIWSVAALSAIPIAASLGLKFTLASNSQEPLEQSAQCEQIRTPFEHMFVYSALFFFIVPMIIVTVLYILIALELRRSSRMNNAISKQASSHLSKESSHSNNNNNNSHCNHHHHHHHHQHQHHHEHLKQHKPHRHHSKQHHHKHSHDTHSAHKTQQHCHCHHSAPTQRPGDSSHYLAARLAQELSAHQAGAPSKGAAGQHLIALSPSYSRASSSSRLHPSNGGYPAAPPHCLPSDRQSHTSACVAGVLGARPASAIGNERPSNGGCPLSKTASDISCATARPDSQGGPEPAGKLCNHLLPLLGGWSSTHLAAPGDKRPASAASCQVALGSSDTAAPAKEDKTSEIAKREGEEEAGAHEHVKHTSLSRQHSPLSFHESLIQRNTQQHHHSAIDMSSSQLCSRSFHAAHQPHHQLSLTHLPANHQQQQQQQRGAFLLHQQHCCAGQHFRAPQAASQHSRRSNAASSKKSVVRMLVAVVVSFFICWVPFHAQRLLASYLIPHPENQTTFLIDLYQTLTYISGVTYYLSSTINPLLYQLMSAKFRLAFKETFNCSLFKCAIFRRGSTAAATAVGAAVLSADQPSGVSPHNSLKGEHRHSTCYCCQCRAAVKRTSLELTTARSSCDDGAKQAAENNIGGGGGHKDNNEDSGLGRAQRLSGSSSDLRASQSGKGGHQSAITAGGECAPGSCCCCCCPAALAARYQRRPLVASAIFRLKGRLNSSMTSLFRTSRDQPSSDDSACVCQSASICGAGAKSQSRAQKRRNQTPQVASQCHTAAHTKDNGARGRLNFLSSGDTREGRSAHCPSAPLLDNFETGELIRVDLDTADPMKSQTHASHLQTNFPAHHTMLKFVRSPTPSRGGGGNNCDQVQSLTRLSSREDDDDPDEDAMLDEEALARSGQVGASPGEAHARRQDELDASKMGALIRATRQEEELSRGSPFTDRQDESELLLATTSTNNTATTTTSNSAEGQSSVGSSPDQLAITTVSTNPTSVSSASSLSLLAARPQHAARRTHERAHAQPSASPDGPAGASMVVLRGRDNPGARRSWRQARREPKRRSLRQPGRASGEPDLPDSERRVAGHSTDEALGQLGRMQISNTGAHRAARYHSASLSSSELRLDSQHADTTHDSHDDEKISQSTAETSAPDDNVTTSSLIQLTAGSAMPIPGIKDERLIKVEVLPYG